MRRRNLFSFLRRDGAGFLRRRHRRLVRIESAARHARQPFGNCFCDLVVKLGGVNAQGFALAGAGGMRIDQCNSILSAKLLLIVRVSAITSWALLHLFISNM